MAAGVSFLQHWLVVVALLRLLSVYLGYFNLDRFKTNLFDKAPEQVTELYGRTFAIWTTLSCVLCLVCARNPTARPIYGATLASFVIAIFHFVTETAIYGTMSWKTAAVPLTIAGFSTLWMGFGINYYTLEAGVPNADDVKEESKDD